MSNEKRETSNIERKQVAAEVSAEGRTAGKMPAAHCASRRHSRLPSCATWGMLVGFREMILFMRDFMKLGWVMFLGAALLLSQTASAQESLAPEAYQRSLVSAGDTVRLQKVLAKAREGKPITVGVIGGSITQGAKSSKPELKYSNQIAQWWRTNFPKNKVEFVNAGIGATGSNYGALRVGRDLLAKNPDFIVVEYAVNDGNTKEAAETLEGLIRHILKAPNQPAVVMLFTMRKDGGSAQEWHSKVGAHYHLPMVSFRDALWPEIQAGKLKWEDVEADEVHPNDRGHAYAAEFVTRFVESVAKQSAKAGGEVAALPKPLLSDKFEFTKLLEAGDLKPVTNKGWVYDEKNKAWQSETPGSVIEFEIEGTVIYDMCWRIKGPMGRAKVSVDDKAPQVREAWFNQTWGGYRVTSELARDLAPGKHRVKVELLVDKNAESTGTQFRILGLGAAGVR
jgi:lysophospholipase L1-like esterase